jgi:hypothetical protein
LVVLTATRSETKAGIRTVGDGLLKSGTPPKPEAKRIKFDCNVSLYSRGKNLYPARLEGTRQLKIKAP